MLCDDLEGWDREGGRGYGDICILTADSLCCTAETDTTLLRKLYSNKDIKNNKVGYGKFRKRKKRKENPSCRSQSIPALTYSTRLSLIWFWSLNICLFWIFHIDEMKIYKIFCIWLLLFSIMFSGFIHIVACIITFYCRIVFQYMDMSHFVYPFTSWIDEAIYCLYL